MLTTVLCDAVVNPRFWRAPLATVRCVAPELVDLAHLVGAAEIARRLGLAHTERVHNWRRRYPNFPAPVLETPTGPHLALARRRGMGSGHGEA